MLPALTDIILDLVREVVTNVDPDVRNGDSLDIRPYVKIKIIPGGSLDETTYVDGVVFRKNVAHKKMLQIKQLDNPKILILGGGLEFHRVDTRLSSMDTLIEQENHYTELLIAKVMLLKPDIILVGKSVSRKAMELLLTYNVVVMQNVKSHLLQRIARMTGATVLSTTDNLAIQANRAGGCLGYGCGRYWLRQVNDNLDRMAKQANVADSSSGGGDPAATAAPTLRTRILKQAIVRGSAYVYLQGCPADKGCTLVLRGDTRSTLSEIKTMLKFSLMMAYHLRLEVAYYSDRCAVLPAQFQMPEFEVDSDEEDELSLVKAAYGDRASTATTESESDEETSNRDNSGTLAVTTAKSGNSIVGDVGASGTATSTAIKPQSNEIKLLSHLERHKLSISMDIDIKMPYLKEVSGINTLKQQSLIHLNTKLAHANPEEYQSLLVTSLLMTRKHTQRSRAEMKCMRFYIAEKDLPLGQFLVESCFSYNSSDFGDNNNSTSAGDSAAGGARRDAGSSATSSGSAAAGNSYAIKDTMLTHTLSFAHRSGRIDISVTANSRQNASGANKEPGRKVSSAVGNAPVKSGNDTAFVGGVGVRQRPNVNHCHLPIVMSSYCKKCGDITVPHTLMSDETWKMSFGKFLEISFYNRSATCCVSGCNHCLRDDHVLFFSCGGYLARFVFVPLHPYSLGVRYNLPHPIQLLNTDMYKSMLCFSMLCGKLLNEFTSVADSLAAEVKEILGGARGYTDSFSSLMQDLDTVRQDVSLLFDGLAAESDKLYALLGLDADTFSLMKTNQQVGTYDDSLSSSAIPSIEALGEALREADIRHITHTIDEYIDKHELPERSTDMTLVELSKQFPLLLRKGVYAKTMGWNGIMERVYYVAEQVRVIQVQEAEQQALLAQQNQGQSPINGGAGAGAVGDVAVISSARLKLHNVSPDSAGSASISGTGSSPRSPRRERDSDDDTEFNESLTEANRPRGTSTAAPSAFNFPSPKRSSEAAVGASRKSSMSVSVPAGQSLPFPEGSRSTVTRQDSQVAENNWNAGNTSTTAVNVFTKAFSKFILGKESGTLAGGEGAQKYNVNVSPFLPGHYSMPSGRNGEVIVVHDDKLSSIIAYSLASQEYHDKYQEYIAASAYGDAMEGPRSPMQRMRRSRTSGNMMGGEKAVRVITAHEQTDSVSRDIVDQMAAVATKAEQVTAGVVLFSDDIDDDDDEDDNEDAEDHASPGGGDDLDGGVDGVTHAHGRRRRFVKNVASRLGFRRQKGRRGEGEDNKLESLQEGEEEEGEEGEEGDEDGYHSDGSQEEITGGDAHQRTSFSADLRSEDVSMSGALKVSGAAVNCFENDAAATAQQSMIVDEDGTAATTVASASASSGIDARNELRAAREKQLLSNRKTHIKHRFEDVDNKGLPVCKYICHSFWATQFEALRVTYFENMNIFADDQATPPEKNNKGNNINSPNAALHSSEGFIRSLSASVDWQTSGGKSGAGFSKTGDDRFVIKLISRTELQMFLEFAPAYFEYMSKAVFHTLPTALVKILGVYQIGYHNRVTGKKNMEQVVVLENLFYKRNITKIFDLKGSSRNRYVDVAGAPLMNFEKALQERREFKTHMFSRETRSRATSAPPPEPEADSGIAPLPSEMHANLYPASMKRKCTQTLLDDNFVELTQGRPFPLKYRAKVYFQKAVLNDTLFLSIVNIVDYSILVGFDETTHELIVGIIDYMRQYDFIKRMERMGKSTAGLLTGGSTETTIIQPAQYRKRFQVAMEKYFMTVPDKWISHD